MQHAQLLELVRHHIRNVFGSHGVANADDCCETILINDGFYCGRRFACDNHRAIWFLEEQVIKFYGPNGEFLSSLSTNELQSPAAA